MSVALVGLNPSKDSGIRFFCNSWEWHTLVEYYEIRHPEALPKDINLHFLDSGSVVSSSDCFNFLQPFSSNETSLDNLPGAPLEVLEYINLIDNFLASVPDLDCQSCLGSGLQREGIVSPNYLNDSIPCKECNGSKKSRPYICNYGLTIKTALNFLNFVKFCGGFIVE